MQLLSDGAVQSGLNLEKIRYLDKLSVTNGLIVPENKHDIPLFIDNFALELNKILNQVTQGNAMIFFIGKKTFISCYIKEALGLIIADSENQTVIYGSTTGRGFECLRDKIKTANRQSEHLQTGSEKTKLPVKIPRGRQATLAPKS